MNLKIFEEFLNWCRNTFQHPIVFICIATGVLLIFIGVGGIGMVMDIEEQCDFQYKLVPLIAGIFLVLVAIFLTYNPPQAWIEFRQYKSMQKIDTFTESINETKTEKSFEVLKISISKKQNKLLKYIEQQKTKVLITQIEQEFKPMKYNELYYRLEQLRLIGFISKGLVRKDYSYFLSDAYRSVNKKIIPDVTRIS